jgi:hypothetical protein
MTREEALWGIVECLRPLVDASSDTMKALPSYVLSGTLEEAVKASMDAQFHCTCSGQAPATILIDGKKQTCSCPCHAQTIKAVDEQPVVLP